MEGVMHHFRLSQEKPHDQSPHGFRIKATKKNFPALLGMSLYKLVLHPQAAREPHWHANADELGFCAQGKVLVSIFLTGNQKETFIVSAGQAFLIPSGALHTIENIGKESAELILQFSHEEPEDFNLSTTLTTFSDTVLGNAWGKPASYFQPLPRPKQSVVITKLSSPSPLSQDVYYTSKYQFSLDGSSPLISHGGGSAKAARQSVWPLLTHQAVYRLILTNQGMREPHWHPKTAELGYVEEGMGRMSILSPSGKVDTYTMEAGDIYFIPKAYPHHIENLGKTDLKLLIFFDQPMPGDIGFTASIKSNSNEVLGSVFGMPPPFFEGLPLYYEDLFIVNLKTDLFRN
jgi:oxalate decarboxylase